MLARKSRKNITTEERSKERIYRAAGYIRLSVVKDGQTYDSVATQTAIIENHVADSDEMMLHKLYIDENASGATFERKAFQEMLSDIENGTVNCVIVKDLSRLGRNFLETGYYIEEYFPIHHVRFIAISDEFDTINGMANNMRDEPMNGIRIPITNLFNEEYANDISAKTQATIGCLIRQGKYVAPRAPYGYRKDPADCHALIVDPDAAEVVKRIYSMASQGVGLNEIVRKLNTAKVLPPLEYAKANGLEGNYEQGSGLWNTRSVKKILTNNVYVGDLMQGKDNYLVQNTHEALVNRETFAHIQRMFTAAAEVSQAKAKPTADNILKGKVICGCCGGKMQRRKGSGNANWYFFTCITNNRMGAGNCAGMYIREFALMEAIKADAMQYGERYKDTLLYSEQDRLAIEKRLTAAKRILSLHIDHCQHSFEQSALGEITQEEFKMALAEKKAAEQEVQAIEAEIERFDLERQKHTYLANANVDEDCLKKAISGYLQSVTVYNTGSITVQWTD